MVANRSLFLESLRERIAGWLVGHNVAPEPPVENTTQKEALDAGMGFDNASKSVWDWYYEKLKLEQSRNSKYLDYDQMDEESAELSSALDLYADNVTNADTDTDSIITFQCDNPTALAILEETKKTLNLDAQTWSIARTITKYGEDFEELVVDSNYNIVRMKHLKGINMRRNEDVFGRLEDEAFSQLRNGPDSHVVANFKKWQIVHFRMLKDRHRIYGSSILEPIRKTYKQLCMMEDAVVIARLTRAHLRLAFLVDTGGLDPEQTLEYLDRVKKKMKKQKVIDPATGKFKINFNPLSIEEDVFVGTKPDGKADVKTLEGSSNIGVLKDLEYFQNKLFSGIKVPKSWLGLERDVNAKATLTGQEIQFARTVRRLGLVIQNGYRQIFDLALTLRGINPNTVEYEVRMPLISAIDEMHKWQMQKIKLEVGRILKSMDAVDNRFVLVELLGLTDEEATELLLRVEELHAKKDNEKFEKDLERQKATSELAFEYEKRRMALSAPVVSKLKEQLKEDIAALRDLSYWILGKDAVDDTGYKDPIDTIVQAMAEDVENRIKAVTGQAGDEE